jgi:hypothetical protein
VVLEEHKGGAKFAMGAEPQVLSGEKRGPIGTGSETVEKRVGEAIQEVKGAVGAPGDISQAAKEGAQDVQKHVQGLVREGKKQVNSFQRSVDEKSAVEKRNPGWKSHAFDI